MNDTEFNIEKVLENILYRLRALESHIVNFIFPMQDIQNLVKSIKSPPILTIDDRSFKNNINSMLEILNNAIEETKKIDISQTFGEIKYIGKRLNDIEVSIAEIKREGIKKNIQLDFTCEGYEMVKKTKYHEAIPEEIKEDPEIATIELLKTVTPRERDILVHRLGLLGEKKKTLDAIGKMIGITRERARLIYAKAIRKLRHPARQPIVEKITHAALRKEITGD